MMDGQDARELFGRAVRTARVKGGVTQAQLAERIGIDEKTVSRIEKGATDAMLSTAMRIAASLGSTMDALATKRDAQSFESARRAMLKAMASYLCEKQATTQETLEIIRCGIENEGVKAWIDTAAEQTRTMDDLDAIRALCRSAGESPEIFGGMCAADLRELDGRWSGKQERTLQDETNENILTAATQGHLRIDKDQARRIIDALHNARRREFAGLAKEIAGGGDETTARVVRESEEKARKFVATTIGTELGRTLRFTEAFEF